MTYPPGGDPNVPGQDPNPDWWDQPAQQAGGAGPVDQGWQQTQVNWTAQQGYTPDAGYGQQPAYQPAPVPQPAGYAQQPGFPPGAGYGQPGFPPPGPPKSKTGLIVGVVVGAVVVLAIAVGGIVLVSKKDNGSPAAAPSTVETTLTTSAPLTTRSAPTTSKAAPAGKRFSYTEYGQDWNFQLGAVALQASYVSGRDYDSCAQIEKAGKLTGLGCRAASEMAWKAENGELMLTQLVLTMSDADKAAAASGNYDDTDVVMPAGSYIADFETGKWIDGDQGTFLVITEATATAAVDEATVNKYLKYRSSDTLGALAFR
ncbi:hypothetical protein [Nocardia heshunensis]